jgi:hypothetical protein
VVVAARRRRRAFVGLTFVVRTMTRVGQRTSVKHQVEHQRRDVGIEIAGPDYRDNLILSENTNVVSSRSGGRDDERELLVARRILSFV